MRNWKGRSLIYLETIVGWKENEYIQEFDKNSICLICFTNI